MRNQINDVIEWVKKLHTKEYCIRGCLTGSCLLDYFEGQDIDIFLYDENSYRNLMYKLLYSSDFHLLDPLDKWKFEKTINSYGSILGKQGLVTIKFMYNTCIPVNIILKKGCRTIYDVLATFDMDILAKGYDLETGNTLDLTKGAGKVVSWNTYNTSYHDTSIWDTNKLLRQLDRCFKYHERGYDTDLVVVKYITIINDLNNYQNIFNSNNFNEMLKVKKKDSKIVRSICELWLKTHKITKEDRELLLIKTGR